MRTVQTVEGTNIVLTKNGVVSIRDGEGRELEAHKLVIGAVIYKPEGGTIKKGETLVTWEPYAVPIITEKAGVVDFRDMIQGITLGKEVDARPAKGSHGHLEHKEDLHPQIVIVDPKTKEVPSPATPIPSRRVPFRQEGRQSRTAGTTLAKTPRKVSKTKDITGGLPRVAELFEARKPKEHAEIAKIDGVVDYRRHRPRQTQACIVKRRGDSGRRRNTSSRAASTSSSTRATRVKKGQQLTEGPVVPHEILDILGPLMNCRSTS